MQGHPPDSKTVQERRITALAIIIPCRNRKIVTSLIDVFIRSHIQPDLLSSPLLMVMEIITVDDCSSIPNVNSDDEKYFLSNNIGCKYFCRKTTVLGRTSFEFRFRVVWNDLILIVCVEKVKRERFVQSSHQSPILFCILLSCFPHSQASGKIETNAWYEFITPDKSVSLLNDSVWFIYQHMIFFFAIITPIPLCVAMQSSASILSIWA